MDSSEIKLTAASFGSFEEVSENLDSDYVSSRKEQKRMRESSVFESKSVLNSKL